MEIVLIFECAACQNLYRVQITNVGAAEEIIPKRRLPEGWRLETDRKTYCDQCINNSATRES